MKKLFILFTIVFCSGIVGAQVSKTVNVTTAGTLSLTTTELQNVTNLTVTGNIDASDIRYIRKYTAKLAVLDLSATTIMELTAYNGTYFGENVTYPANELPKSSFSGYDPAILTLTSVILPSGINSIGELAFSGNTKLTNIVIPPTVATIKEGAFSNCAFVNESFSIPNSVRIIGASAFAGTKMTNLAIPALVVEIGDYAFYTCKMNTVSIPNSVTKMGKEVFRYCSNLTSATIGNGLERLPSYIFADCYKLTNVELSNGLKTIGDNAFYQCTTLSTIKLPSSVSVLESAALWGCSQLTTIYSANTTPPTLTDNSFYGFTLSAIYVPAGSVIAYQQAYSWNSGTFLTNNGNLVTNIFPHTFTSGNKLSSLNFNVNGQKLGISVNGVDKGQPISIYSASGKLIKSLIATGTNMQIPIVHAGVYLVRINNTAQRVFVSK